MCSEYGIIFNPESEKIYTSMARKLMYMDPAGFISGKKLSILYADSNPGFNYGRCKILKLWLEALG